MKNLLLFLVLICGTIACTTPKQLEYQDVKNFRIRNLTLQNPEIGMDLQFYNPNPYSLTLKDADISIYINDKFIGKAALTQTFEVPQLNTFLMPVALTADLNSIFKNALALVFNQTVDVHLVGSVKAGKGIFLNIPIDFRGKEKLNVF